MSSDKPKVPDSLIKLPKALAVCEFLANPDNRLISHSEMCNVLHMDKRTLDKYLARADVKDYIRALVQHYTDIEMSGVWKSLVKTAKKGNVNAMKLFFEMKREYVPPNQVTQLEMKNATANINIVTNIPRPRDKAKEGEDSD